MRTDHCMATRWAAAPWAENLSGCASCCSSFQRASRAPRSCANRPGTPNSSKSLDCRFTLAAGPGRSDPERFAATAAVAFVRVVEAETLVQAFTHEVQLRAVDVGQALGIHQDLDALVLEYQVLRRR